MDLTEKQILSRRASQKKYRDKNKEKYNAAQNEYTKAWYQRNKELVCEKKRNDYAIKKLTNENIQLEKQIEILKEQLEE